MTQQGKVVTPNWLQFWSALLLMQSAHLEAESLLLCALCKNSPEYCGVFYVATLQVLGVARPQLGPRKCYWAHQKECKVLWISLLKKLRVWASDAVRKCSQCKVSARGRPRGSLRDLKWRSACFHLGHCGWGLGQLGRQGALVIALSSDLPQHIVYSCAGELSMPDCNCLFMCLSLQLALEPGEGKGQALFISLFPGPDTVSTEKGLRELC